ncbi:GNAT family N-acetyltransferase [Brevundimonas faecalis]|uniref:GNAT family N-acetyltransferase n=1 Tax=Brevundimonas faecalis TaxID=947378 RepID=UPI003616A63E
MRPPVRFQTARLDLRPVEATDAPAIFSTYAGQVAPTRFMNFVRHAGVADSEAFARRCVDAWASGQAFPWAVTHRALGQFMGVVELRASPPKAELGYIFGDAFWGQGFASEAASAVVDWTMTQDSIFRIWATCHPDNAGSAGVLRNLGLTYEATLANWEERPQLGERAGASDVYAWVR